MVGLDKGTHEDATHSGGAGRDVGGAGRDVGDANLDSDSDAGGTGERASAGRDTEVEAGSDIAPDRLIGSTTAMPADTLDRIIVDADENLEDDMAPDGEQ